MNYGPDLEPIKEEMTPRESVDVNAADEPAASARGAQREVRANYYTQLGLAHLMQLFIYSLHRLSYVHTIHNFTAFTFYLLS